MRSFPRSLFHVFSYSLPARVLTGSVLAFLVSGLFSPTQAGYLSFVSDTISTSQPSASASHLIAWTSGTAVTAGLTMKLGFDPVTDAFDLGSVVVGDISASGMTVVANIGACGAGSDEVYPTIDATAPDEHVTLTVCPGDTVIAGSKTVTIGNSHIVNPGVTGSYPIRISGTQPDQSETRVAIVSQVIMSAKVETLLTFTILGLGTGVNINGAVTSTSTSPTTIGIGTLTPNTPVIFGQQLNVSTNARNGFTVTVREDQNLTSGASDIDTFIDGAETATPIAWVSPAVTLGDENTYGHIGLTSNDSNLNAGEFVGELYAGNFLTSPRAIFHHTGPSDGTTQDIGTARVAYKIEVSGTQESGDYSNTLIYVCTPVF
jgi:hypothetical protein